MRFVRRLFSLESCDLNMRHLHAWLVRVWHATHDVCLQIRWSIFL